jgi:hypothetical protein
MAGINLKLEGYVPANRNAKVSLVNEVTGERIERQPFLDGTLLLRDMDPGPYELEVTHPNLIEPIERRKIRVFPQPAPTFVSVPVPADLFRDSPIRDIPDADLGPVQQTADSVRRRLAPLAAKGPGEAIRAADWNALVGSVADLSTAVLELTRLVSPQGHAHPEIAEKIGEVQENIRRFAEAYGRSLLELRREIETAHLRQKADEVLDLAGAATPIREAVHSRIGDLQGVIQADSATFTQKLSSTGGLLLTSIADAVAQSPAPDDLRDKQPVKELLDTARSYHEAGTVVKAESELLTYQRSSTVGGAPVLALLGQRER